MKIAVVSYNQIFPYSVGVRKIKGTKVLFLPKTFPEKDSHSVTANDKNFARLMKHASTLEKIFIFAGKKESRALEIIQLFADSFSASKSILFFVLCDHNEQEKIQLLDELGFEATQKIVFRDWHEQCQEGPILKGLVHDYIDHRNYAMRKRRSARKKTA
ncbi:MAG: hypothetical protein JWL92_14 [Candidatus Nomurabacteria bacterium]|nr:hypothetical protein [Candidatus Nomurabacteria bacterium]